MAREPNYRKELVGLTEIVTGFLQRLDMEMCGPSTPERGKRVADISNKLEMINDRIRYHVLGSDYRTDTKPARQKAERKERERKG